MSGGITLEIVENNYDVHVLEDTVTVVEVFDFSVASDVVPKSIFTGGPGNLIVSGGANDPRELDNTTTPPAEGSVLTYHTANPLGVAFEVPDNSGGVIDLYNNSGGAVDAGTVIVFDNTNTNTDAGGFKTTTRQASRSVWGVVKDAVISNGALGKCAVGGTVETVKVTGNVAVGAALITSSSAGYAEESGVARADGILGFAITAYTGGATGTVLAYLCPDLYTTASVPDTVEYLVVAGGGGGGFDTGGGGGGGGYLTATGLAVATGAPITVTVGAGGTGGTSGAHGGNGGDSVFGSITATGGGGGGCGTGTGGQGGAVGGSGGGGARAGAGAAGTAGQGNAGTAGYGATAGGGGGGASANAGASSYAVGGAGGVGLASSISGASVNYAGGGGGGAATGGAASYGGGAGTNAGGTAGTANTGGGGGGGGNNSPQTGGAGGSGIVIIRYPDNFADAESTTGSPTFTNTGGYKIYKWTSSGSITF